MNGLSDLFPSIFLAGIIKELAICVSDDVFILNFPCIMRRKVIDSWGPILLVFITASVSGPFPSLTPVNSRYSLGVFRAREASLSPASGDDVPVSYKRHTVIPGGKSSFDEFLNRLINITMLGMQIVDVARQLDASIIHELDVGRQPLISIGPKQFMRITTIHRPVYMVAIIVT